MGNTIQAPKDASAETQEILKELEAEGRGTPVGQEATNQPEKVEEPNKPAESVTPPEKAPEQEEADKKATDESGKKPDKPNREEKFVPVGKHNEERHKRQEAESRAEKAEREAAELRAQINGLSNKPTQEQVDDVREAATKLAGKHGLDAEFVAEFAQTMVDIASKRNVMPKEIEAKLASFEQREAQREIEAREHAQEIGFNNEFADVLKEFPDLADRKEDLKQLATSEGNTHIPLRILAISYRHDNPPEKPGRKTAEVPTSTKKDTDEVIDFENMTEEQFKGLNDEQFGLYEKWLAKKR